MQKQSITAYALITNDGFDVQERRVNAVLIADHRLKRGYWPLYSRTPHKNRIAPGDWVAVYIGGQGPIRHSFYAVAQVCQTVADRRLDLFSEEELVFSEAAERVLLLDDVSYLSCPAPMKSLLGHVSFAPKKIKKWGVYLMGGCKAMSGADFELIRQYSQISA